MTKKGENLKAKLLNLVEDTLDEILPREDARPGILSEAMRYAVGTGGKRIRPLVCFGAAIAAGGKPEEAKYAAAAIELLHNYTLVHDDLPAMDNDETRRGKPTVWKKFGEANAILAGDALQAMAFRAAALSPANARDIVCSLGRFAKGVVDGQIEDIAEGEKDGEYVYLHKTADLFIASAMMGAQAVRGRKKDVAELGAFACCLGHAFQFQDDLLDGDGLFGREETERLSKKHTEDALAHLDGVSGDTSFLRELAKEMLGRKK